MKNDPMRLALLPAALLAACAMTGASLAGPVALTCPAGEDAEAARLCAALDQALRQSGHRISGAGASLRLVLHAQSPRPGLLRARLTVEDGAGRHEGEEVELSVTDRASIPDSSIRALARSLLETALPDPFRN